MAYTKFPKRNRGKKRLYKKKTSPKTVNAIVEKAISRKIEKKEADPVSSLINDPLPFGNFNGPNVDGWQALDINPDVQQGFKNNERVGNRLSITSGHLQFQLQGMRQAFQSQKFKIVLLLRKNVSQSETPSQSVKNFWLQNPFSGVIDANSSINTGMRSNYQILRSVTGRIPAAKTLYITNTSASAFTQPAPGRKSCKMGFKFKKPLTQRYDSDGSVETTRNSMILVFLGASDGDRDAAVSTGIFADYYSQMYYTDA